MKFLSPLVAILALASSARAQSRYPFRNPDLPLEQRVTNILSLMTLEEKTACLDTNTAVPRLGIPNIGNSEGLHGLSRNGGFGDKAIATTTFPEVIGMASTWDPELIRRAAAAEAEEARYITQTRSTELLFW